MSDNMSEFYTDIAIKQCAPSWYAQVVSNNILSESQMKIIDESSTQTQKIKFLSRIFPELRNKLHYRFLNNSKFNDSKYRSKFKNTFRTALLYNLRKNDISCKSMTESMMKFILGYTIDDLMKHLESKFDDKMNWNNQGSYWHIDHIYPCSKLKYITVSDDNFKKLWSLDNLQPLEASENISKSNKVTLLTKERL